MFLSDWGSSFFRKFNHFFGTSNVFAKKYFANKFVTFETTVEEDEDLVISGLGWINVKRGPLTIELTVPEGVKVIVRPSIFKGKK